MTDDTGNDRSSMDADAQLHSVSSNTFASCLEVIEAGPHLQRRQANVDRVSPVGRIYFPLMGDVTVVGKTLPQLQEYFTNSVAEFIKDPRLTLALLEAQSAKIGVLGDVKTPGVLVMTRPLRVLDAITLAGGILDTGSSNVSILRQYEDGRVQILGADMKKILSGKANPEENG